MFGRIGSMVSPQMPLLVKLFPNINTFFSNLSFTERSMVTTSVSVVFRNGCCSWSAHVVLPGNAKYEASGYDRRGC